MTQPIPTLGEARATALAAGVPSFLVDAAEKSGRAPQDWGSFCWVWQAEIKAAGGESAGELLRAVHTAARVEHAKSYCENRGADWRCGKLSTRTVLIEGREVRLCATCTTAPTYETP